MAIKTFQDTMMCALFINSCSSCSSRNDFGGGCEMSLHADKVVAAETYGLWEFGVELYQVVALKMALRALIYFIK
jgi:3-hydroxyacyl-CoA dehydrogenase